MFTLSLLIFLFSVLVALFSFLGENQKRRRFYKVLTLVCVFANLLLAFALKHAEDSQQLQREQERTKYAQELAIKAEELAKKSDEITRLNKEIASAVTEGDSYAFFAFLLGDASLKNPVGVLMHYGKQPLYDVVLYVYDYTKWKSLFPSGERKFHPNSEEDFKKAQKLEDEAKIQIEVGTVRVGEGQRFQGWKLPDKDELIYSVRIKSRFQTFNEHLKLKRVNGVWKQAFRVFKYDANKKLVVLKEDVPTDFPRDVQGDRFWEFR